MESGNILLYARPPRQLKVEIPGYDAAAAMEMTLSKRELTMRQPDGIKSRIILVFEIGPTRLLRLAPKKGGPQHRYYEK
jgi:hypothetical protein|tara:strand:- start:1253 stop:1489 length:237 start_codon:yes stop_codon:yes gene_type:complete